MCEVESRSWPGINKPGGIGCIKKVYQTDPLSPEKVTHVDVFYPVLRTREKYLNVDWLIVKDVVNATVKLGAEGRGTLGRCERCGSLRRDCGACDWKHQEGMARRREMGGDEGGGGGRGGGKGKGRGGEREKEKERERGKERERKRR